MSLDDVNNQSIKNIQEMNVIVQMNQKMEYNKCSRLGCNKISNSKGHACFCSDDCNNYVMERVTGCGILLIGSLDPEKQQNYMILGGYKDTDDYQYEIFSGKLDPNETIYDCAIRELEEESGMILENKRILNKLLRFSPAILRPTMIKGGIFDHKLSKYFMIIAVNMENKIFNIINMHLAWFIRNCKVKNNVGYSYVWVDLEVTEHFKLTCLNKNGEAELLLSGEFKKIRDRDQYFLNNEKFIKNCNILVNKKILGIETFKIWNDKFHM